jgi:outer membrane biosynthesis protein TonB
MSSLTLPKHVHLAGGSTFADMGEFFKPSKQDQKFKNILKSLFVLYLLVAIVVPLLELPEVSREVKEKVPVQLARIVLKEKPKEKPKPKPKVEVKEEKPKEKKVEKKVTKVKRDKAKAKASSSGLAAMKDDLFAMRDAFNVKPASSTSLNKSRAKEVRVKRKLLTAQANTKSSGLKAAKTSQSVVSDDLSTRSTQQVRLSEEEILASNDTFVEQEQAASKSGVRSEMVLRRTLDSHKSRLYSRYNRALRKDPFLKGNVLFEIEIQPSGKISKISIKSSELKNKKLERQLLAVLRGITFPASDVGVMVTIWSIDFLPS